MTENHALIIGPLLGQSSLHFLYVAIHVIERHAYIERKDGPKLRDLTDIVSDGPHSVSLTLTLRDGAIRDDPLLHRLR